MKTKNFLQVGAIAMLALGSGPAFAAEEKQTSCNELVKECFAYSELERTDCFSAAGKHTFCEGTSLGELILRRWSLSPDPVIGDDDASKFLGAEFVDSVCMANFDNQLSAEVIKGTPGSATIQKLSATLEACRNQSSIDLHRP